MSPLDAIKIVQALADGIDPETGEVLDAESPLNLPSVIRALNLAVRALEGLPDQGTKRTDEQWLENAGAAWVADEDKKLLENFDRGTPIAVLAKIHRRSAGAITSRLVKHGRLGPPSRGEGAA